MVAIGAAVLIIIIGIFAAIGLNRGNPTATPTAGSAYAQTMQNVPAASLDAVGVGVAKNTSQTIPNGQPDIKDGKPRLLYIGAEFCPYCAIERWPMVIALSRFGTWQGLQPALSSPNEGKISDIPTVTFQGATYSSDYLTFEAIETADRMGTPIRAVPAAEQDLLNKYNPGTNGTSPIPWLYWGTAHQVGASYDGTGFMPSVSGDTIAAKLGDATSPEAQGILGAANIQTAQLCKLTKGQPANVCTSAGVQAAAQVVG